MKKLLILALLLLAFPAYATQRASTDYRVVTDTLNSGGGVSTSGAYSNRGSIGGIVGVSTVPQPAELNKGGYVAQLGSVIGYGISAPTNPASVIGGEQLQLSVVQFLDDGTTLPYSATTVVWSVLSGPISVDNNGMVTTSPMLLSTSASVNAKIDGMNAQLTITVLGKPARPQITNQFNSTTGHLVVSLVGPDGPYSARVPGKVPGWRFAGETEWRSSGVPVYGLSIGQEGSAAFIVELESIVDFSQKPPVFLPAPAPGAVSALPEPANNSATFAYSTGMGATGLLKVQITPDDVARSSAIDHRGQWRFAGEDDTAWRDSGAIIPALPVGSYLLEFKPVSGFASVPNSSVLVSSGQQTTVNVRYGASEGVTGDLPQPLTLSQVTTQAPYEFVGQIHSPSGQGSGVAITDQVVLTAAHVIFNDADLTFTGAVQWQFERHVDPQNKQMSREPRPLTSRGAYVLSGYTAARQTAPFGVGNAASQQQDAAALYFLVSAANGRGSGYLLSNGATTWLTENRLKILAGYPTDVSQPNNTVVPGQMQATAPQNVQFNTTNDDLSPDVFATMQIAGLPGMSGGPLFVLYDDGKYYPAGIYLGGDLRSVVRSINSQVKSLIDSAILSSQDDGNHTDIGYFQTRSQAPGSDGAIHTLIVNIDPPRASWHLLTDGKSRSSGGMALIFEDSCTVGFSNAGEGLLTPPNRVVALGSSEPTVIQVTYQKPKAPTFQTPSLPPAGLASGYGPLPIKTSDTTSLEVAELLGPAGNSLDLHDTLGLDLVEGKLTGAVPANAPTGKYALTLLAKNRKNGANLTTSRTYQLTVSPLGTLAVGVDPADGSGGSVTGLTGTLASGQVALDTSILLAAVPKAHYLFSHWSGVGLADLPIVASKLDFQMNAQVILTAHFVPDFFPDLAGTYLGLIQGAGGTFGDLGLSTLKVMRTGSYTATLNLGPKSYKHSGKFNPQGDDSWTIAKDLTVAFNLDVQGKSGFVYGTLTNAGKTTAFAAEREAVSLTGLDIGPKYTVAFPHSATSTLPQGDGYGVVAVKSDGTLTFTGVLGDGTRITKLSGAISQSGHWVFYKKIGAKGGLFAGLLAFEEILQTSDLDGQMIWLKPADSKATTYPAGFSTTCAAVGSRFASPLFGYQSASATFGDATLIVDPLAITLDPTGKVTDPPNNVFTLAVTPGTGRFTGAVTLAAQPPQSATRRTFGGVLLQKTNTAYGLYTTGQSTGFVQIVGTP